jgi:hypothetical protein
MYTNYIFQMCKQYVFVLVSIASPKNRLPDLCQPKILAVEVPNSFAGAT